MRNILLMIFLLISSSFAESRGERFYKDVKGYIAYEEGNRKDVDYMKVGYVLGKLQGFLDFYETYGLYNKILGLPGDKQPESVVSDPYFFKKICLNNVSEYQLAKSIVKLVDNDPKLLESDFSIMINLLMEYRCNNK